MTQKIYTAEQERYQFEEILRDLGITLNNNYFRVKKGFRPFLHRIFSRSRIYRGNITQSYFLAFTENQLVMMYRDHPRGSINDNIVKIDFDDIDNFSVSKGIIYYCLQFEHENESFYFYIDADGSFQITEHNYSNENFHVLKAKNFNGLLRN